MAHSGSAAVDARLLLETGNLPHWKVEKSAACLVSCVLLEHCPCLEPFEAKLLLTPAIGPALPSSKAAQKLSPSGVGTSAQGFSFVLETTLDSARLH